MEKWEQYLINTKEKNINYERLETLKLNKSNLVYEYILRCLDILDSKNVSDEVYYYVRETLKWSDVSKCGSKEDIKSWKELGFSLSVHNIASSEIYVKDNKDYDEVVRVLIKTHGLIGQYIRGEINLDENQELYLLIEKNLISKDLLREVLIVLNECVVGGVSKELYTKLKDDINNVIDRIISNDLEESIDVFEKLKRLNSGNIEYSNILENKKVEEKLRAVFRNTELWYYEVSLKDFSLEEQVKLILMLSNYLNNDVKHIMFVPIMKSIYLDYNGKKTINIYKKRIIENMLKEIDIDDILNDNIKFNAHVKCDFKVKGNILYVNFKFSKQAEKLIEFCEVAYTSNSLYNKAVYILFELFGFRRDEYDRFYNEIDYLNTMNSSMDNKRVLVDFITGKSILDVGPGGGALMNIIEVEKKDAKILGIDISKNVIEELTKKKNTENHRWNLIEGDALNLGNYLKKGEVDTIIYSSIIHELFSYIPFNGKKFNIETVIKALKSADDILNKGGRIIIRDGIKTEPINLKRIIEFKNKDDMRILDNYCNDFKGRKVIYEKLSENRVKMLVNDAMEFLYTYTWGENSYSLEVKEQFGYLTPSEYLNLIKDNLSSYKVIYSKAFLQNGYEENLLNKISIYDEDGNVVKLPNSTFILVLEKE